MYTSDIYIYIIFCISNRFSIACVACIVRCSAAPPCGGRLTNSSTSESITPLVDKALLRMFTMRMRLGHFDTPEAQQPWSGYSLNDVDTGANRALAEDAALQGFVLLKNDAPRSSPQPVHAASADAAPAAVTEAAAPTLPLRAGTQIAVVGPYTNAKSSMLGNYHERQSPSGLPISPCAGITATNGGTAANDDAKNADEKSNPKSNPSLTTCQDDADKCTVAGNTTCFTPAVQAAISSAEVVILAIGIDQSQEAEGKDRVNITLPGMQNDLIDATAKAANGKPIVAIMFSGSALDVSMLKADKRIGAIMWVGYPGEAGGSAIAAAVFGAKNQWGKLPMTWYKSSFLSQANLTDYRMRPDIATGYPGRTHRFFTGVPLWPFGTGLSYTTFSRSIKRSEMPAEATQDEPLGVAATMPAVSMPAVAGGSWAESNDDVVAVFDATVANVGSVAGDDVVMLYVEPPAAAVAAGAPRRQLAAFARTTLGAGETQVLRLELQRRHLRVPAAAIEAATATPWKVWLNENPPARKISSGSSDGTDSSSGSSVGGSNVLLLHVGIVA